MKITPGRPTIRQQFNRFVGRMIKSLSKEQQTIARLKFASMGPKAKQELMQMWARMDAEARIKLLHTLTAQNPKATFNPGKP